MSSPTSCGACGNACVAPESCIDGVCSCPAGEQSCGSECRDVRGSDVANCGGCDRACGVGAFCDVGRCRCPEGQSLCSADCHDTARDPVNCGRCGAECDVRAGHFCSAGVCGPSAAWAVGFASEDSFFADGQRDVAVALDPIADRIYVAYSTLLTSGFQSRVTVVALDEAGAEVWTSVLGTYSRDTTPAAIDVGGGRIVVAVTDQVGVSSTVLLDAGDGSVTDRISMGIATMGVAVDSDGGFIVVGFYRAGFTVGSVMFTTVSWHTVFVVRFDADAEPVFGFRLGDPSVSELRPAVALADDGSFFVAAAGGGRSFSKDGVTFPGQGWIAGFDAAGTAQWAQGASLWGALDIALSPTRVVLYAQTDGFVGGVDAGNETFMASWTYVGDGGFLLPVYPFRPNGGGVAYADSRFFVTSPGRDDYSLGRRFLAGSRIRDSIVAEVQSSGTVDWLTSISATDDSVPEDVAASSAFVILVGRYGGTLAASDEVSLPSMGEGSVYVVRIDR